ncbi:DUF5103 domain-containing protein [Flavobacterium amnicola]|uniref:DUF5103 domain-containing protein n=1 Tax=Flavobacterium amnicola TaxID=2506422 RepID=A0A4Q1K6A7_9FLAO|nr:DUF5103 domain-containing protein [Flavobacterium amnicola]RXR21187.1 DUF5103 domain-containing protein [Flavobacterium amnicola]
MNRSLFFLLLFAFFGNGFMAQTISDTAPPFNIKTVTFTQGEANVYPFFRLGESFQFSFDDLFGNEEDYYFTLTHCNYNWTKSDLSRNEYLDGNDNQRIQDYENSFNTLQIYSHYRLKFPNNFCRITKSGNYLLSILNSNRELVFSKKFVVYEELAEVAMQVKRSRNVSDIRHKHNLDFAVKSDVILFQNPAQNVKVILFQNGKWSNMIVNVKPQFTIGNDLIFKYNLETQFWAGNEYLYFDNKEIRVATNSISKIDSKSSLYNAYLYTNSARRNKGYTFFPDVNGNFQVRNLISQNNQEVESDYSWVNFSLFSPETPAITSVYVTGMFNDNVFSAENKMEYNPEKGVFEKAILIKQGFTNYNYTILNAAGVMDEKNAVDGNYYETENVYNALVYYRANGERYDRVIGKGEANSTDITN